MVFRSIDARQIERFHIYNQFCIVFKYACLITCLYKSKKFYIYKIHKTNMYKYSDLRADKKKCTTISNTVFTYFYAITISSIVQLVL